MGRLAILAVLLTALFAHPATAQDNDADAIPDWVDGRTFTVAFAQDHMANDWRASQVRSVREGFAAYPFIDFLFSDAEGSTARQIVDIENFAAQGVDVLITSPRDAKAMAPVIAKIEEAGIPVVLLSRRVEGEAFTTFITADNKAIAAKAGRFLAETLNGKGRILVLQHIPTTTPGRLRTEGFMEAIADYPGIEVAAIKRADSLRGLAIQKVEEAIREGIEFDAIYAQSDSMASGARMALRRAGIDPATVPTVGIDYIAEAQEAILAGNQAASFVYPTFGKEGVAVTLKILQGQDVPKTIVVDSTMITRDNAADIEPIF